MKIKDHDPFIFLSCFLVMSFRVIVFDKEKELQLLNQYISLEINVVENCCICNEYYRAFVKCYPFGVLSVAVFNY